ncbi:MAG: hypothetical protein GY719_40050 [bacterium]|nr:hypothetical protein [bacterium]
MIRLVFQSSAILWIAFVFTIPASAQELPPLSAALYAADDDAVADDEPYRAGRRALDEGKWSDAARYFSQSAESGSSHTDGAHYWRAYALHKDGRSAEAMEVLAELRHGYQDSAWLDDARALEMEIRSGGGSALEDQGDEELKLLALDSLMHSDSERAMPMLKKFLDGNHSRQLRERALFVMSQSDRPEAAEMLLEVARGDRHPDIQLQAVHYLGISDAKGSGAALAEIYRSTADKEVKSKVLHSFMISDENDMLLEVARTEQDVELRRDAIHQLGVMDATDALKELYGSETQAEVKEQILHSLFIADDDQFLATIARTESDEALRRSAIRSLGLVDSDKASATLVEIYSQTQSIETKEAILQALFLSDDDDELIRIARTETDPELRKTALKRLSLMDSEKALDFMMEILEQ